MPKITLTVEAENIRELLDALSDPLSGKGKIYADQAAASAFRADSAARNSEMALDEIRKLKDKSKGE